MYIGSSIKEVLNKETFDYAKILIGGAQRRNSGFFLPLSDRVVTQNFLQRRRYFLEVYGNLFWHTLIDIC